MEKQRWKESEKRREERSEKRKSHKKKDQGARKDKKPCETLCFFPLFCGFKASKGKLRRVPSHLGMRDEHAIVA